MAAASIGQVHRAVLPNGHRVAVKVQRPAPRARSRPTSRSSTRRRGIAKERVRALDFIDTRELVDEFARSIRQELDYRLEGRNAETFRRNFAGHPHVRIPRVYWTLHPHARAHARVPRGHAGRRHRRARLTIEDRRRLAYLMTEAWMTMIFRHGFFHGDPHPANILVLGRPDRIGLVDFGLAGQADRLGHLQGDAALHRRRERERRRPAEAPRRPRRPLPARARGGVRRRAARALLPLLRRAAVRHRPAAGDPRGLRAHLLASTSSCRRASCCSTARSRRSARSGSSSTRSSTSSRWRSRTRAA